MFGTDPDCRVRVFGTDPQTHRRGAAVRLTVKPVGGRPARCVAWRRSVDIRLGPGRRRSWHTARCRAGRNKGVNAQPWATTGHSHSECKFAVFVFVATELNGQYRYLICFFTRTRWLLYDILSTKYSPGLRSRSWSRSRSLSRPESVVLTGIGVGVGKFSSTPTPARSRSRLQDFFIISLLVKMETEIGTEHFVLTADSRWFVVYTFSHCESASVHLRSADCIGVVSWDITPAKVASYRHSAPL